MAEQRPVEPIYLTFDDGPDPYWTPRVLELLAAHGAAATFFLVGRRAVAHPGLVCAILAAGHGIGNHTFNHFHPWRMREAHARRDVRDGAAALEDICGRQVRLFRPPYGRLRPCMNDEAAKCGQALVLWHRSAIDWGLLGRSAGIARRLGRVRPGEIVLMHDCAAGGNHPEELLRVLPELLRRVDGRSLRALSETAARRPTRPMRIALHE
jgi:peptidoglycan-N-acetylglucosamine deacetylase